MSKHLPVLAAVLALSQGLLAGLPAVAGTGTDDFKGVIGPTDKESKPYYPPPARPPKADSPSVVYIVLDDVGFADLGCYGSEIKTPNIDRLAAGGLRYNNFHTRAICSPTRAALLTGRNSHSVGLNTVANFINGFPNGRGHITPAATTLAEVLRPAGYSTFALGKWHLVPLNESSAAGPYDQWPLGRGFDHYYGFLDGLTDQYKPELVKDNTYIDPPHQPGYHLSTDLVDQSIRYVRDQRSLAPDRPFFLYLAFGAAHAPHQVPKPYIDKYLPVFEKGWDRTREDRFARQKQMGIVPAGAELAPRNEGIKPWQTLSTDEKKLFVRFQAAFAGFLEHTDEQIGRLVDFLGRTGELDNTIVVLISDNGASQEGGFDGFVNEVAGYGGVQSTVADSLKQLDAIGTERATSNYPRGWAMAGNTPFKRYKQNLHGGGVHDPLIVHWPKGIKDRGAVRSQFVDVIDITPTILDLTGIGAPIVFQGVPQKPIEGASIAATFGDPKAPNPRHTQYFEMWGSRALWNDGWKAVTFHKPGTNFDEDRWELYNLDEDYTETKDLAAQAPEKLKQLQDLWWTEARRYNVLPLDNRDFRAVSLQNRNRPGLISERSKYVFYPDQAYLPRETAPNTRDRSFSIAAQVDRRNGQSEGVLLANGDFNGGYVFYVKDNRLVFDHNDLGKHTLITSALPVPTGKSLLRYVFTRTGESRGTGTLFIGDRQVGEASLSQSQGWIRTWAGVSVGRDRFESTGGGYTGKGDFAFTPGGIEKVIFEVQRETSPLASGSSQGANR